MSEFGGFGTAVLMALMVVQGGMAAQAMPIQPVTVLLWDMPSTNQIRGTAVFEPFDNNPSFTVRVSLKAAGPGPDTAVIGTGTCTKYTKLYILKPVVNGLSNTTVANGNLVKLFKTPHVIALPKYRYCGALKSKFL